MDLPVHCLSGVRTRRQYLGLSADEMAQRLGITRTSYLRYERGERRIMLDQAKAMASMLGCTCEQLGELPTPDEVRALYAEGQRRQKVLVDDETGQIIRPPEMPQDAHHVAPAIHPAAESCSTVPLRGFGGAPQEKPGIVVAAHVDANAHDRPNDSADRPISLSQALEGWGDDE
jgi:transcriptional regulator with XRE-family HTH domain